MIEQLEVSVLVVIAMELARTMPKMKCTKKNISSLSLSSMFRAFLEAKYAYMVFVRTYSTYRKKPRACACVFHVQKLSLYIVYIIVLLHNKKSS